MKLGENEILQANNKFHSRAYRMGGKICLPSFMVDITLAVGCVLRSCLLSFSFFSPSVSGTFAAQFLLLSVASLMGHVLF